MPHEHHNNHPHLLKTTGIFSILGGLVLLGVFFYKLVVLGSYNYTAVLAANHSLFLPWINLHKTAYAILWGNQIVYALLMLSVPYATTRLFRHSSNRLSSLANSAYIIGMAGFYLIITAAIVLFAAGPVIARSFVHGDPSALLMFKTFSSLGLHLRLFGELLAGIWISFIGLYLVGQNKLDLFGWYCLGFPLFSVLIIWGKLFKFFNWDPFLSIILALTFIWLGREMRVRRSASH